MDHHTKDRPFWTALFIALVSMLGIFLICGSNAGCGDSQTAKPTAAPKTRTSSETETDDTLEAGDNSSLSLNKMITNIHKTVNTIVQHTDQTQKSASTNAESIKTLTNKINNTNNSSWLMFGIVCMVVGGNIFLIIVLMRMRIRVTRAIDSPDNSLTRDQYRSY